MSKQRTLLLVVSTLLLALLVLLLFFDKKTNWYDSFNAKKDAPFDLSIFTEEIENLLPNKTINYYNTSEYLDTYQDSDTLQTLLFIGSDITIFNVDWEKLENSIKQGNDVFIISRNITIYGDFYDKIIDVIPDINQPLPLTFTDAKLKNYQSSFIYETDFKEITVKNGKQEILGHLDQTPIFLRYKIGKGYLYMHYLPHVYSNHYLLNNSLAYPSAVLSYIKNEKVNYLNHYFPYKNNRSSNEIQNNKSILYFFLQDKHLRMALYLFIFGGLCFVLFKIKRTQRVIPIVPENKNRSLEFVQTLSNLYFNQKDNKEIVYKLNHQFLAKIEQKYHLKTTSLDTNFIKALSKYTNLDEQFIAQTINQIKIHNSTNINISKNDLTTHYLNLKKIIK